MLNTTTTTTNIMKKNQTIQISEENFSQDQKQKILKRDNYKCVICGKGKKEGIELHVDHIKPKYLGGKAIIENGQTLCAQHNFIKKSLKQTETGKKMFIRLYELAKKDQNKELLNFCDDVLRTYQKHNINGHVIWKR
jgi:5-methylcytosine-specific restriction endonuclease McrA